MSERVIPSRTGGLITAGVADALWVELTADCAVPTASAAFTGSPATARLGYVLLGGHVVATAQASGGSWGIAESEVRWAAAELNAVEMDRYDVVRIGPFRSALKQQHSEGMPLRWRQRIMRELQEPATSSGQHLKPAGRTMWRGSIGGGYSWSSPATGRRGRGGCPAPWSGCWTRPSTPKGSGCEPGESAGKGEPLPRRRPSSGRPQLPAADRQ
ncbi:hypothetical protein [Streptomyces chryseus]